MNSALGDDLQSITGEVVRMLSLVREACELAARSLLEQDEDAAARAIEGDSAIDSLREDLETRILTVIARRQPAAGDLRFLGAAYQSVTDLERAGDYAEHVARAGLELAKLPPLKRHPGLRRIFEVLARMLAATTAAFVDADLERAGAAHAMDQEIDELYVEIQRELLGHMIEEPANIARASTLIEVGRYLERLGDHIENVNEHIAFWLTGDRHALR